MRKKEITAALILSAVCVLSGCTLPWELAADIGESAADGGASQEEDDSAQEETPTESGETPTESGETPTESGETPTESEDTEESSGGETTDDQEEDPERLAIGWATEFEADWDEEIQTYPCSISYTKLYLSGETDYPALAVALEKQNQAVQETMEDDYSLMQEYYAEDGQTDGTQYTSVQTYQVLRADSVIVSMWSFREVYMGGPHPSTTSSGFSVDPGTGTELALSDVLADTSGLAADIAEKIAAQYPDAELFEGEEGIRAMIDENTVAWGLGGDGLEIFFSPGQLAAYAAGSFAVSFSYDELDGVILERYAKAPAAYTIPLSTDSERREDLDGDGETETICVSGEMENEYYDKINIVLDGMTYTFDDVFGYSLELYLMRTAQGDWYLFVESYADSDWRTILVYSFDGGEPEKIQALDGHGLGSAAEDDDSSAQIYFTNPDRLTLDIRTDYLSSLTVKGEFVVAADGRIARTEDYYYYGDDAPTLTSRVDLALEFPEEEGTKTVPAGSSFTFYRIYDPEGVETLSGDGDVYLEMKLEDGSVCRVYPEDEYPYQINGMSAEDVFDGMFYAG